MKNQKNNKVFHMDKTIVRYQRKIDKLGLDNTFDANWFLSIRFITSCFLFVFILWFMNFGYIVAPIVVSVYYYLLSYVCIDTRINKRARKLEGEAITFFDVLKLTLASGKDIISSLQMTSNNVDGELSLEVKYALREIKFGKSLEEALDSLRGRVASDVVSNIILNIKESSIFGTNIIDSLDTQIQFLRDKRVMDIKEVINKIPIKISAISVIFFIPILMLLILSPILIEYFIS